MVMASLLCWGLSLEKPAGQRIYVPATSHTPSVRLRRRGADKLSAGSSPMSIRAATGQYYPCTARVGPFMVWEAYREFIRSKNLNAARVALLQAIYGRLC